MAWMEDKSGGEGKGAINVLESWKLTHKDTSTPHCPDLGYADVGKSIKLGILTYL